MSFSKLKTEMKRPIRIDLASYYPDISAVKTFEEVSKLVQEVTEPPEYKGTMPSAKPGGPSAAARPPGLATAGGKGPKGEKGPTGEEEEEKEAFTGHKIELMSTDIDRTKGSLRGDCDSQDALLAFQEGLTRHRCFHKVKSSSDRITFQRHKGWFRFTMRFEIHCPDDTDRKGKKTKAKKGKAKGAGK